MGLYKKERREKYGLPNITNAFPIKPHKPIIPKNTGTTIETIRSNGHSVVSLINACCVSSHHRTIVEFVVSLHFEKCIFLVYVFLFVSFLFFWFFSCYFFLFFLSTVEQKLNWRVTTQSSTVLIWTWIWAWIKNYVFHFLLLLLLVHHKFNAFVVQRICT